MPLIPTPVIRPQPHSRWIGLSIKIGLAVAVLTILAQWAARLGTEKPSPAPIARSEVADPVTTGTIGTSALVATPAPAALDQQGLTSLVLQVQGGPPVPKAAAAKKR